MLNLQANGSRVTAELSNPKPKGLIGRWPGWLRDTLWEHKSMYYSVPLSVFSFFSDLFCMTGCLCHLGSGFSFSQVYAC